MVQCTVLYTAYALKGDLVLVCNSATILHIRLCTLTYSVMNNHLKYVQTVPSQPALPSRPCIVSNQSVTGQHFFSRLSIYVSMHVKQYNMHVLFVTHGCMYQILRGTKACMGPSIYLLN